MSPYFLLRMLPELKVFSSFLVLKAIIIVTQKVTILLKSVKGRLGGRFSGSGFPPRHAGFPARSISLSSL